MGKTDQSVSLYTWGCSLFAAVGSLLYGIDSGIISTTISQPTFLKYFAPFNPSIKGAVVSIFAAGSLFGVLFAGWAADHWGIVAFLPGEDRPSNPYFPRTEENYPICFFICFDWRHNSSCFS